MDLRRATAVLLNLFVLGVVGGGGELFTALVDLEKVLHVEHAVAHDLRRYVQKEERRLERLRRLADDFERHSSDALVDVENHLSNPVNAYLLIKRFTNDWNQIIDDEIKSNTTEEFLEALASKTGFFPNQEDLNGAAFALLRLQDTYALAASKIANGELQGVTDSPRMSAEDCFVLGNIAYVNGDYYHTIIWMKQALETILEKNDQTIRRATLLDYLSFSYYKQGNLLHALNYTEDWLRLEPNHIRAQSNKAYYEQEIRDREVRTGFRYVEDASSVNPRLLSGSKAGEEFRNYEKLCRGEQTHLTKISIDTAITGIVDSMFKLTKSENGPLSLDFDFKLVLDHPVPVERFSGFSGTYEPISPCKTHCMKERKDQHLLTCQYKRHHPVLYIRPAKEELLNLHPRMYIYHNILSDEEIRVVKELATPRLARSVVYHKSESAATTVQDYRISKSGWLQDYDDALINRISQKASAIANLSLESAEPLQVLNYGIGGHYETHYDFATNRELSTFEKAIGNRIATVICYLTDVAAGGGTVFPSLGLQLIPEKGSCVLWYNLLKSGEGDYRTNHAACPVLTGFKWVCNKWFHERGQEFIRPCKESPYE